MNRAFLPQARPVVLPLLLGILMTAGAASLASATDDTASPEPEFVTVEKARSGGIVTLGGQAIPHKLVTLSAQMPGDVKEVAGEEGDRFKAGAALVKLDVAALLAKRRQAVSQLASARAGYRNAVMQLNREIVSPNSQGNSMMGGVPSLFTPFTDPMRTMMGQGDGVLDRRTNVAGREVAVETAANSVRQAQDAIDELDSNLENSISRAPFDGVIINKMVEVGDIVQPGMPLVSFADTSRMQIQVEVPTRLVHNLKPGEEVLAQLDNSEDVVPVKVARIFPMAQAGGHTTTVKFDIPKGVKAKSGTYAEVMVQDSRHANQELPVIPRSAIVWRGSLPAVFVLKDAHTLKMKILRPGPPVGDDQVSVMSGISVGDQVLKNPTPTTRSGPMN